MPQPKVPGCFGAPRLSAASILANASRNPPVAALVSPESFELANQIATFGDLLAQFVFQSALL